MEEEKNTTEETKETKEAEKAEAVTEETETESKAPVEKPAEKPAAEDRSPAERTFTQNEVDEIVKKRLARAEKGSQEAARENAALKNSIACYKAGVKAECIEDAIILAGRLVDDKTDFDAALAKVMEKYPGFGSVPQVKNSSVDMQNAKKTDQSMSALRASMGIREEKR
jgi:hypothetical protein